MLTLSMISHPSLMEATQMLQWLWRRLGVIAQNPADRKAYDAVYGYPQKAVAEWLGWNPQLKVAHDEQVRRRQSRCDR